MKIKKIMILSVIILVLAFTAGCKNMTKDSASQKVPLKYGDITDPVELEELWQEYVYDSITTVGNTREFNSAQEIDPLNIAKFCWSKYVAEHGTEKLAQASGNSTLFLFPLDFALEYAQRYFDLTSIDVSKIESHSYDPQKQAFLFSFSTERIRPSYNASNPWGLNLAKATRKNDGTVTAMLVRFGPPNTDRIELTKTYVLKQREDGSLYFVRGRWDYVNNHLVALTGEYQRFDQIKGFTGNLEELCMLGEVDGRLILAYMPYDKEINAILMRVNPETMKIEKKLEVSGNCTPTDVSLNGDSIIIRLEDRIIAVDKTLAQTDDVSLPTQVKEKINREAQYSAKGTPDVFFGGYDISSDRKRYVYADELGVTLFNTADNSEKLLCKTIPIIDSELIDNYYYKCPRFVADEHKVITTIIGYESAMGYTMCDLASGSVKTHSITSECSSTGLIRYDTGLLEVNTYYRENQTGQYKTMYLDFKTGNVKEISLNDTGETGDIRMPDYCYVGSSHAAFITYKWDVNDNANNMFYLNRLNLKTLQAEPKIISVKAAEPHILGVLADGRIVFWYSLNPSESGICVTK